MNFKILDEIQVTGSDGSKDVIQKVQALEDYDNTDSPRPLNGTTTEYGTSVHYFLDSDSDEELSKISDTEFLYNKTGVIYRKSA